MRKNVLALVLAIVLVTGLCPFPALAQNSSTELTASATESLTAPNVEDSTDETADLPGWVDATQYTYEVTPLVSPFNKWLYVKTDNPNPYTFAFLDKEVSSSYSGTFFWLYDQPLADVAYEDKSVLRVHGGYLYQANNEPSNGGELTLLMVREVVYNTCLAQGTLRVRDLMYGEAGVTVPCPVLKDAKTFLIDEYTDPSKSLFDNLDAVQAALDEMALYPRKVRDMDKVKESRPWPCWAVSPYKELGLNSHLNDMFEESDEGVLIRMAYPFVLDSLGFPGMMTNVACLLSSGLTISYVDGNHSLVSITKDGTTKTYGGQGQGGTGAFYISAATDDFFTFDGSDSDLANGDLAAMRVRYHQLGSDSYEAYKARYPSGMLAVPSSCWIRVAVEGGSNSSVYAYYNPLASDAWVDGRYVNEHEYFVYGETFKNHSKANIIMKDMKYIDKDGKEQTSNVLFQYQSSSDTWRASSYIWASMSQELKDQFVLTRAQVEEMQLDKEKQLDRNTNVIPESGLIYDGTEYPGTPFVNTLVEGVEIPDAVEVSTGKQVRLDATVLPANATNKTITWKSSDPSIATVNGAMNLDGTVNMNGYVKGVACGETYVTATTQDGAFVATCKVTVNPPDSIEDAEIEAIGDQDWTGSAIKPNPTVTFKGVTLTRGTDYTVSYGENKEVGQGKGEIVITAKAPYVGTKTVNFNIVGKDIAGLNASIWTPRCYTGEPIDPAFSVYNNYKLLTEGTDFVYHVDNNVNVGMATVTIEGRGNYRGTVVKTFEITPAPVTVRTVSASKTEGERDPVFKATVTGLVGSDTEDAISYKITREPGEEPNKSYGFKLTGAELQGNYRVTYLLDGGLFIYPSSAITSSTEKIASSIKLADQKKTHTGKALSYTGKVTKSGSAGKVTYRYYSDALCTKAVAVEKVKNAGTYYVKATVAADANYAAATSKAAKFTIAKVTNTLTVGAKAKTVKLVKVKKKAQTVAPITVKKAKGARSFKVSKWTTKKAKAHFKVNVRTGKVTAKKGTPKGTYKFTVKVTAKGNAHYKQGTKSVAVTVRVK